MMDWLTHKKIIHFLSKVLLQKYYVEHVHGEEQFRSRKFYHKKVMYHMFVMENGFSLKSEFEDLIFLTRETNTGAFLKNKYFFLFFLFKFKIFMCFLSP